ncbi:MAG: hypothetical protein WC773_00135 [Patescibacteria group bacterium]|jgi:hypothetical protein
MPQAQNLHRRTTHPKADDNVSPKVNRKNSKKAEAEKVDLHVLPVEKHESFHEFYPLNVTKVETEKTGGYIGLIIGLVILALVGGLTFWYVKEQNNATSSSSTPASSDQTGASTKYQNSTYGFNLTLPSTWKTVKYSDGTVCTATNCPVADIIFVMPVGGASDSIALLALDVYSIANYTALVSAATISGGVAPVLVGQTDQYAVVVNSQATRESGTTELVGMAIDAIPTVLNSFIATTPVVTPTPTATATP